jgi:hypothetical protein
MGMRVPAYKTLQKFRLQIIKQAKEVSSGLEKQVNGLVEG